MNILMYMYFQQVENLAMFVILDDLISITVELKMDLINKTVSIIVYLH